MNRSSSQTATQPATRDAACRMGRTVLDRRHCRHRHASPKSSLTAPIEGWVLMAGAKRQLSVGELRRRVRLGSEAVYRIHAIDGKHTQVEVVRAPGLAAGQRFRLSRRDVALMERVATGDT